MNFAAYVGIDWADEKHAVCLGVPGTDDFEHSELLQTPEALDDWAAKLRERFGNRPVAVCLEQSKGALIYALMKYDFLVLFPINPKQLANYREAVTPSGAKDDPGDAGLLADFFRLHHARLKPLPAEDPATRSIRLLSESRRKLVDERTCFGNQLQQELKQSFPLALQLIGSQAVYALWFLTLLNKFPSHKRLQRAGAKTLERILPRRGRSADEPDPRFALIRSARPLVTDQAVLSVGELHVEHLTQQMLLLNKVIAEHDRRLAKLMAEHPDAPIFTSFPGAGEVLAPRLVAAFGTDRDRYANASEVQNQSGTAPVTKRSGKTRIVARRLGSPKFLRQTFHEFAANSLKGSSWAQAYYQMLRDKGKRHHAAVRSLAFKWIRVLFRCWKSRVPYSEQQYLDQLRAKNSPIVRFLLPSLQTI